MTITSFIYTASAKDMLSAMADLNIPKVAALGAWCIVGPQSAPRSVRNMGQQYPVGSLCSNESPSGSSAPREWGSVYE